MALRRNSNICVHTVWLKYKIYIVTLLTKMYKDNFNFRIILLT